MTPSGMIMSTEVGARNVSNPPPTALGRSIRSSRPTEFDEDEYELEKSSGPRPPTRGVDPLTPPHLILQMSGKWTSSEQKMQSLGISSRFDPTVQQQSQSREPAVSVPSPLSIDDVKTFAMM